MEESDMKKRKGILIDGRGRKKRAKGEEKVITLKFTAQEKMEGVEYITHGSWDKSNHPNYRLPMKSSRISFTSFREARRTARFLNSLEHPTIPRLLALDDSGVIVGRMPHIFLPTWLDEGAGSTLMWKTELSIDEKYFLEMEPATQIIFRGITKGLRYLHNNDKYHGNLLNGVFLSTADEVKVVFANFDRSLDFQNGLLKDINDLCTLVKLAVEKHSKRIKVDKKFPKTPPTLKSFRRFYRRFMKCGSFEEKRQLAQFLCWAPLFWDWKDRLIFIHKLDNLSRADYGEFFKYFMEDGRQGKNGEVSWKGSVTYEKDKSNKVKPLAPVLEFAMPRLQDWKARLGNLKKDSDLRRTFEGQSSRLYEDSGGIYLLYINCLKHYAESVEKKARANKILVVLSDASDRHALDDLLKVYPEAMTVFFEKMESDLLSRSERIFGKDLIKFFEEEPEPLL